MIKTIHKSEEERLLILGTHAEDVAFACSLLRAAGMNCATLQTVTELCDSMKDGAAAILISDPSILTDHLSLLKSCLAKQETWSDIPIILTTSGSNAVLNAQKILRLFEPCGNVTLLERPFHTVTLINMVQMALRARRRQYQVRELLSHLATDLRRRDEFMSIASHELKTPLTSLKLHNQLRKHAIKNKSLKSFAEPNNIESVNMTERQLDRVIKIIDDMLDISRINTGNFSLEKTNVELGTVVKEVIEGLKLQLNDRKCEIFLHQDSDLCGHWDRYRIEQVVENLITNAIKYGDGNPITVFLSRNNQSAIMKVRDQGVGIDPENHERVFQRFERATAEKNITGLGLGLYIVKQIILLHGGSICVESELGKGSTFTVKLPLAEAKIEAGA